MLFTVTTRRCPLNVRCGPALYYRVVSTLAKGATVIATLEFQTLREGIWYRINRGWVSWLYLTPVVGERRPHPGSQPLPGFLSFDPHAIALERRLATLRDRLEYAEARFYVMSQCAADEGSRLYERDPLRDLSERLQDNIVYGITLWGGGPNPAEAGFTRANRWARMKEFERNAARYQSEVRSILNEITRLRRELSRRRY